MMRCSDLNFAYQDGLIKFYNFRTTEEYFKSTAYLLKNQIKIRFGSIKLRLFECSEILLTELAIKEPQIDVRMFLNS